MRNSIEVAHYIESVLNRIGMKPTELANRIGVDRSTVTRYLKGTRKISMEDIPKIATAIGVSPIELLIDDSDTKPTNIIEIENDAVMLPIYGNIACGNGSVIFETTTEYEATPREWTSNGEFFYLRAEGDSMVGARIFEGDLLLIQHQEEVENGEIAAVVIGDEVVLKRVYRTNGNFTLVSENPKYPPRIFNPEADTDIRVIGKLKKMIVEF